MPNELFNQMNVQQLNDGGFSQLIAEVRRMQQTFSGNPRDTVQNLLNTGEMTQEQFNKFAEIASQLIQFI